MGTRGSSLPGAQPAGPVVAGPGLAGPVLAGTVVAGAGLVAGIVALRVPWPADLGFTLHPAILGLMLCAGVGCTLLAGWSDARWPVRVALWVLGLTTLAYPTLLGLADAGPALALAAMTGHVLPLTMVNLLPILAISAVTGRSRRRWMLAIGVLLGTSILTQVFQALAVLGSAAWLGNFALPMIATWPLVRGTGGVLRRRAIVCGLASVLPVAIIALCLTLGIADSTLHLGSWSVEALMIGFSLAVSTTAALVWAATTARETWLLRTPVVLGLLGGVLAVVTVIVALGAGLALLAGSSRAPLALGVGIVLTVGVGLAAVRLHGWAARQIDPAAEFAAELAMLGEVSGERRLAVQQVLRQLIGDPGLAVLVRTSDGVWVDPAGAERTPPAESIRLAGPTEQPTAVAVGSAPESAGRLRLLGDCGQLLEDAILEASVQREAARADAAAVAERHRLSRDLHDGVQGRLLGITLNLQLSGEQLADPTARLLVAETVDALRNAVEEVRSLGDGRVPAILVDGGLGPALTHLVRPLAAVTELRLPPRRYPPELEACAYFVVGEALANAVKHATAQNIGVRVEELAGGDVVRVLVVDDGVGGADPRLGSGLRGIAERVSASGGLLVVREGVPGGTVVEATLPCGPAPS